MFLSEKVIVSTGHARTLWYRPQGVVVNTFADMEMLSGELSVIDWYTKYNTLVIYFKDSHRT